MKTIGPVLVAVVGSLAALSLFGLVRLQGMHWNLLILWWMLSVPTGVLLRAAGWYWDFLDLRMYRRDGPAHYRWQAGLRVAAWTVGMLAVQYAIAEVQFSSDELFQTRALVGLLWGAAVAGALVPLARRQWLTTVAIGLVGLAFAWDLWGVRRAGLEEQAVMLRSPLAVDAVVLQGGGSTLVNHHASLRTQQYAVDVVAVPGPEHARQPAQLAQDACFGQPVVAPVDGVVAIARGDLRDNPIGKTDVVNLAGNHVVIEVGPDLYVMLAHLKQGSVGVEVGQRVQAGQPLGQCGNSGNTTGPHVHLQVQNRPDFSNADPELYTRPIRFDRVLRGGALLEGAAPRRNDTLPTTPPTP